MVVVGVHHFVFFVFVFLPHLHSLLLADSRLSKKVGGGGGGGGGVGKESSRVIEKLNAEQATVFLGLVTQ